MDTTEIINSITQIAADFGLRLLYAVLIIFVGRWVVKLLLKIIKSALEKTTVEETIRIFVANLLNSLLMVIIFIAAINQLGIETTSIIAMLGAAGLAIGLALQGSLANFAAGILIVIFRPYKVGDYIEAGSAEGTVLDIQIFSTVLKHLITRWLLSQMEPSWIAVSSTTLVRRLAVWTLLPVVVMKTI